MARQSSDLRSKAILWLVEQYVGDPKMPDEPRAVFEGNAAICRALEQEFHLLPGILAAETVQAWDNEARNLAHDAGRSVTSPVPGLKFIRDSNASAFDRLRSRFPRLRQISTLTKNGLRQIGTDAQQSNALAEERTNAILLKAANDIMNQVITNIDSASGRGPQTP